VDDLILYLLSTIGLCAILKYGTILNFVRDTLTKLSFFKDLFDCALCLGFYTGIIVGIFTSYNIFIFAFASAGVCWFADHILILLKNKIWPD
jgi:hypothetical protein